MKVTLLLCDAAQVADGKLYVLGAGWTVTGPMPVPSAIGLIIGVPWDQAGQRHTLQMTLLDGDGRPVLLPGPEGDEQLVIEADLEVERPADMLPGVSLDVPFAVNLGPLPLAPGNRFYWQLEIDGQTREDWVLPFATRGMPPQVGGGPRGPADIRI